MTQLIVITPTGERPEAFAICKALMQRQTLSPDKWKWVVVDDGQEVSTDVSALVNDSGIEVVYHRPDTRWSPGVNTMLPNMKAAIAVAKEHSPEYIAFVEDDDWYHHDYLKRCLDYLEENPDTLCLGESRAKYYNLRNRKCRQLINSGHASLCQTVVHFTYLPLIEALLDQGSPFFDMPLWAEAQRMNNAFLFPESTHAVGIKGLPGRAGIGIGHTPPAAWDTDHSGDVLKSWVGEEDFTNLYLPFMGQ